MHKLKNLTSDGPTSFVSLLTTKWDEIHKDTDIFRYKIDKLEERLADGKYLLQLNPDRQSKRRAPEEMNNICQPFDEKKFNFNKVSPKEILFSIEGEDADIHAVLVNVSPISRYHSLLCPSVGKCLPQVVTPQSLDLAVQIMFLVEDRDQFKTQPNSQKHLTSEDEEDAEAETTAEETSPKTNWEQVRKNMYQNCVLGQMGLLNLKTQADAESDGETTECEDILTEEEATIEFQKTMEEWEEYIKSVRIQHGLKVNLQNFITDLINSSLTIKEQEDPIGMSYTTLAINSGDLTHDWEELFDAEPTRINQLAACLVFASIFIPAMVVKSYKMFSVKNILNLVSAQSIIVEWEGRINGKLRTTKLTVPKGEIQYFDQKVGLVRDLRIGFNSMCGFASVNHLHYHLFVEKNTLYVEKMKWQHIKGDIYCLDENYPVPAFCFEIQGQSSAPTLWKVLEHFLEKSIAHNILLTKSRRLGGREDVVDVIVWPRRSTSGAKKLAAFNVAVLELSGWFPIYDAEAFKNLQAKELEAELLRWIREDFKSICEEVKCL